MRDWNRARECGRMGGSPDPQGIERRVTESINNRKWPWNTLLVSRRHRVIYLPIAKNANTSLKRLFVRASGHVDAPNLLEEDVHDALQARRTGLVLADYNRARANRILRDPDYFRFTVLRNPLSRAVSGYVDKFVIGAARAANPGAHLEVVMPATKWAYAQRGEAPDVERGITFEEFVAYLGQAHDDVLDTHFKSQGGYLRDQSVDFVGAMEDMQRVMTVLAERFGQPLEAEWHNRTRRRRRPSAPREGAERLLPAQFGRRRPHAEELLTPAIVEQLEARFSEDLARWRVAMSRD